MNKIRLPSGKVVTLTNVPQGVSRDEVMQVLIKSGQATEADFTVSPAEPPKVWDEVKPLQNADQPMRPTVTDTLSDVGDVATSQLGRLARNAPNSLANYVKDVVYPWWHPQETAESLWGLAKGSYHKLFTPGRQPEERYPEAVGQHYSDRYGTLANVAETIVTDPFGAMSDVSGMSALLKVPLRSTALARVARATDPLTSFTSVAKQVGRVVPESAATHMMGAAMHLPASIRDAAAQTVLKHGIHPLKVRSLAVVKDRVEALNTQMDKLIGQADRIGEWIPKDAMFRHVSELKRALLGDGLYIGGDDAVKQAKAVIKDYEKQLKRHNKEALSVGEFKRIKDDLNSKINWTLDKTNVKNETMKALSKGTEDAIENRVPDVAPYGKAEQELLDIQQPLESSITRAINLPIIPLRPSYSARAGGRTAGAPGMVAGYATGMTDLPGVKRALAQGIYNIKHSPVFGGNKIVGVNPITGKPMYDDRTLGGLLGRNLPAELAQLVQAMQEEEQP